MRARGRQRKSETARRWYRLVGGAQGATGAVGSARVRQRVLGDVTRCRIERER